MYIYQQEMMWFLLQFDVIIKQLQIFQRQADRAILLSVKNLLVLIK